MDNHPRHFNQEYAQGHKLQAMLVHPLQVLAFTALGATLLTHYIGEVRVAFTDVTAKFERDAFVGDTLYSALEITELSTADGKDRVTCSRRSRKGSTSNSRRGARRPSLDTRRARLAGVRSDYATSSRRLARAAPSAPARWS